MVITIDGESCTVTKDSVRQALVGSEPEKLHVHWVEIEGYRWPVKQVVALTTGMNRNRFKSRDARVWLRSLGFQIQTERRLKREPAADPEKRISKIAAVDVADMEIIDGLQVTVDVTWRRAGQVTVHPVTGRPSFPPLLEQPGLYRFDFGENRRGEQVLYVGETKSLARRASNYRNATKDGGRNRTSRRIHKEVVEHITNGGVIEFAVATEVSLNGGEHLDLRRWSARRMAENAAVLDAQLRPATVVLNIDADTQKVKQIEGTVDD